MRQRIWASPRYRWWALGLLVAGYVSTGISITILAAVLPTIAGDLRVGPATIAWVVTGPMLVVGVFTPTMGKAGDLYGRKRVYLMGWAALVGFAGACAAAGSAGWLIAFRLLGAVGGAAVQPTATALILGAFGPEDRVRAMSLWGFVGAAAPVAGLVAGGPLVDLIGWRWIFAVQPVLAAPALVLSWWLLRSDRPEQRPVFDVAGSALLACSTGSLLFGLNRAGTSGWSSPEVLLPLVLSPPLAVAFVLVERRHPAPLLPLDYLRMRNVVAPTVVMLTGFFAYMGSFFVSPFLLHQVLGYGNARTSFALLPRPLANAVLSFTAGWLCIRFGERMVGVAGMLVQAAGMAVLVSVGGSSSFWLVVVGMVLTGAGLGAAYPGLIASMANSVRAEDFGTISAMQTLAQTIGMVAGMQSLQTVQAVSAVHLGEAGSFRVAFAVACATTLIAALAAAGVRSMRRAPVHAVPEPA